MRIAGFVALVGLALTASCLTIATCNYAGRVATVVQQEIDPAVLLQKYSWFKDASAALDKKVADISVYNSKLKSLTDIYGPAREWPRDVREQAAIWASELAGIKASYNSLAAEYNSQMSKINWAFTNLGQLPKGATTPLPREYKPYTVE